MGIIELGTALFASASGVPQFLERRRAGKRAAAAQEEANQISRASSQVENARRRRQAIAQARIAQAQNITASGGNVQQSSVLSGIQSGISTQLGTNISSQRRGINTQQSIVNLRQQATNALRQGEERAGLFDAFAQAGQTGFSLLSGAGGFAGTAGGAGGNRSFVNGSNLTASPFSFNNTSGQFETDFVS